MKSVISTVKCSDDDELFKTLSEELPVGVCIMQDGKFCYANNTFPIAIGYTVDELVGKGSLEIVVPEDRKMVKENTTKMLKGELRSPYQFRVNCKDGSIVWVMATVKPIQYHGKRATLGNYMEITDRKLMEEAVKESEERYKELANSISDVFFAMDEHLRYTYWNKPSEILTGIRAEDALGKSLREIFPDTPGTRRAEKVYRSVLRTQKPQTFVNDFDIDGRHYIFEISAYPSRGGISVFVKDVTERKQAEERLREAEEETRALLEEAPIAIIHADLDGKITYVNRRFELESGYSREEIIGKPGLQLGWFSPDTVEYFAQRMAARLKGSPARHWETQFKCKDGRLIWIELEGKVISTLGVPVGFQIVSNNITERMQAEQTVRESEEKYRTLAEQSPMGLAIVQDFRIVYTNRAYAEMFGYSVDELLSLTPEQLQAMIHPEDQALVWERYVERLRDRAVPSRYECRVIRKDGKVRWIEVHANRVDHDGKPAVQAAYIDITDYKRAEEALRQSEERYRTILDEMEEGYYEVDIAGNFTFVNDAMTRILGYSRDQLIGMNYKIYTPEEDVKPIFQAYNRVYRTGEPLKWFPMPEIRRNGTRILAEDSVFPLRNQKGEVMGFRGISRDITERKRMEESLRQSEENYRALFDSSVIGTFVLDAETMTVVMDNEAAAKMFGLASTEEAIGTNLLDFIPPEDKESVLAIIVKELFEQDLRRTHQLQALTKDGRRIWVSMTGARIIHGGRLAGLISFADITEQKRQNERLMMTDRLASIGELAAGAAHELNNPLTSIIGFSELLMEKDTPDYIRKDLAMIRDEARRAANVMSNLLTFARKHRPVKQPTQINDVVEDVLKLRAYAHKSNCIVVERHLNSDLPEIAMDRFQMQQVFLNIVINAEYFMTQAHKKGTLTITTKRQNGSVAVSFADDGPGIPPENLRRIFDPFFTTKEAGKGTGLGLSICHGIVAEHGGQIYAASQPGNGATIFIELPINGSNHVEVML